jgi:hypothetical protein
MGRPQRQLEQLGGRLQRPGHHRHRVAGLRRLEQGFSSCQHLVASRFDDNEAGAAEQRQRGRLVGQPRRIRAELAAAEVDPVGVGPERGRQCLGERA